MTASVVPSSATLPGDDPAVQALAIHEAAHTVAALRGRGRVRKVELVNGGKLGWTRCAFPETPDGHWASVVTLLAAIPAEGRFVATIVDKSLGEYRMKLLANDPTGDVSAAHSELEELRTRYRDRRSFHDAERAAATLVDRNWDHIQHIAEQLLTAPNHTLYNVRI